MTKIVVMIEFRNDYNLRNLAEETACYKISQSQICIDLI